MHKQTIKLSTYRITGFQNNKQLFNNINCSLTEGCLLYIQGPNGSGKTTLLKIITGLLLPTKGDVYINYGLNNVKRIVSAASFIKSNALFDEEQVVIDYLVHWGCLYNGINRLSYEYINKALDRMGLKHEKYHKIAHLSLGQRKRLQIALCLITDKPIWVMDEPAIGLDKYWTDQLSIIVEQKCSRGGIVLLTTHMHLNVKNTRTYLLHIDA